MSVFITHHNESIYDIKYYSADPQERVLATKKLDANQTISVNDVIDKDIKKAVCEENLEEATKQKQHKHAHFGLPEIRRSDPKLFLKKRTGHVVQTHYWPLCKEGRRSLQSPPVPDTKKTVEEQTQKLVHPRRNFIKRNILRVLEAKPKPPERNVVFHHTGSKMKLCADNEVNYTKSKRYAKLPKYVNDYKIHTQRHNLAMKLKRDKEMQPECSYIVRHNRKKLLEGLKSNWEELQSQYQTLPILTDTIPKKIGKSQIEKALQQLEKDIVLLERHPYIYVYPDES